MFSITIQGKDLKEFQENLESIYNSVCPKHVGIKEDVRDLSQELLSRESGDKLRPVPSQDNSSTTDEGVLTLAPLPEVAFKQPDEPQVTAPEPIERLTETKPKRTRKKKDEAKPVEVEAPSQPQQVASLPQVPTGDLVYSLDQFKSSMPVVMFKLIQKGLIDQAYIKSLNEHFGTTEIIELVNRPDDVEKLYDQFVSLDLIKKA